MPPVPVDPRSVCSFANAAELEGWLGEHHARRAELWLKIHKKGSGMPSVTYAEALDVALAWGWIDGLKKSFDELSFLQRFTPRRAKSGWSQRNREHVDRLTKAGRMRASGLAEVEAAKADGRWAAAYAPPSAATYPADLVAAIEAVPAARATFARLDSVNRYALIYRLGRLKTEAGRARAIATTPDGCCTGLIAASTWSLTMTTRPPRFLTSLAMRAAGERTLLICLSENAASSMRISQRSASCTRCSPSNSTSMA